MSPIDRELESTLSQRASGLVPPGDLFDSVEREARSIRRRRGVLIGAAALSVLAIAVAVPLAVRDSVTGGERVIPATEAPAPTASPTPAAEPTPPPPNPGPKPEFAAVGRLRWPARGSATPPPDMAMDGDMMQGAKLWYAEGHQATDGYTPLWRGALPDGRVVYAFEAIEPTRSFAVFAVRNADSTGLRIVQGLEFVDQNPQGPAEGKLSQTRLPQVSAYIDGPQDFVVIVGAPTTGQLEFSTDSRRYTTVETVDGTGVVAVTKGDDQKAYRVRVYDGDGVAVYDGPIDLLRED